MTTTNVTIEEIRNEDILFTNEHDLSAEAFEIELSHSKLWGGDNRQFKLFINGQLKASYTTFASLNRVAATLIEANDLRRVQA